MHVSMNTLSRFIAVLELTREQQQYGFFLAGLNNKNTSNLAEHHYLVTMIAWLLCEDINEHELLVKTEEVLKMCLIHDVGELFGGDVAAPLSRKRPDVKVHARAWENLTMEMLTALLPGKVQKTLMTTHKAAEEKATDEAMIAKIADLIETHFFLEHRQCAPRTKDAFYRQHIRPLVQHIRQEKVREKVEDFLQGFERDVYNKGFTAEQWIIGGE